MSNGPGEMQRPSDNMIITTGARKSPNHSNSNNMENSMRLDPESYVSVTDENLLFDHDTISMAQLYAKATFKKIVKR